MSWMMILTYTERFRSSVIGLISIFLRPIVTQLSERGSIGLQLFAIRVLNGLHSVDRSVSCMSYSSEIR